MRLKPGIVIYALLGASIAATFLVKLEARHQEQALRKVRDAIEDERWRAQTLRADLAFLRRPGRLGAQAEQLDMVPLTPARIVRFDGIERHDRLRFAMLSFEITLPSGDELSWRSKPPRAVPALLEDRP